MRSKAFTLIELSIVLVIIGLIVGGVLVGRDLIAAAAVRSQVTQIEKLQTAVNTFRGKFNNYLPGDIPEPDATRFGFSPRGGYIGEGDGNGVIEGAVAHCAGCNGLFLGGGEVGLFWLDLSYAKLIEGDFRAVSQGYVSTDAVTENSSPNVAKYLPQAAIGRGYLYVYAPGNYGAGNDGVNYFGLAGISNLIPSTNGNLPLGYTNLTVSQAANIDKKMDDGIPQSGKVLAVHLTTGGLPWAGTTTGLNATHMPSAFTSATAGSATTCFDNGNVSGAIQQYSVSQNNGNGMNCALSFKFQ